MSEYRERTTGEVKTQGEWRLHFSNVSLPRVWKEATLDGLNLDPVLRSPKPDAEQYQNVARNGVEQDANGNWIEAWQIVDMFADTTDEDGNVTTKEEHETAYQASLDESSATRNRNKRDQLLAETDWTALSDVTMTDEMAAYRQALRDITSHENWPNLSDDDWPTKP
jgi:hypothetical protein